jgi:hypothetical protein
VRAGTSAEGLGAGARDVTTSDPTRRTARRPHARMHGRTDTEPVRRPVKRVRGGRSRRTGPTRLIGAGSKDRIDHRHSSSVNQRNPITGAVTQEYVTEPRGSARYRPRRDSSTSAGTARSTWWVSPPAETDGVDVARVDISKLPLRPGMSAVAELVGGGSAPIQRSRTELQAPGVARRGRAGMARRRPTSPMPRLARCRSRRPRRGQQPVAGAAHVRCARRPRPAPPSMRPGERQRQRPARGVAGPNRPSTSAAQLAPASVTLTVCRTEADANELRVGQHRVVPHIARRCRRPIGRRVRFT